MQEQASQILGGHDEDRDETTTPEATAEVLSLLDEALAKAMADYRAQAVIDNFVEVEVTWPTRCPCMHLLNPGDAAWEDLRDEGKGPLLCTTCAEIELTAAGRN